MKDDYYDFWKNRIVHLAKPEFFTSQKSIYSEERYLSATKKFENRQVLSKLRLSNHSLKIEAVIAGDTNNQKLQVNKEFVFFATYQKLKQKLISLLSAQRTTLKEKLLVKSWGVTL